VSIPDPEIRSHPGFDLGAEELLHHGRSASPQEVRVEINRSLGIGPRRTTYQQSAAELTALAEEMGLE
jgi:hypothetical protein